MAKRQMIMWACFFSMGALLVARGAGASDTAGAAVEVEVVGLRSERGQVRVALFNSASGFPGEHSKALRLLAVKAEQGRSSAVFTEVPPGTYAVGILHDENANGKMDYKQLVMPAEGCGFSNKATSTMFGPPRFEDAAFTVSGKDKKVEIRVGY